MADEIVLKVVLESDLAEKSVGDLKQDFKDLTNQINNTVIGTKEYKTTLQSLGVVKGGLQDLKQQIQALNPEKTLAAVARVGSTVASGFAAAQGAAALFGSESEDLMKVLVRVQAATALASGLQGLSGFSKALETARLGMIAFIAANPITVIVGSIVALTAGIVLLAQKIKDNNSEVALMEEAIRRLNKVSEERKFLLDEEIRLLEAQKGREEEVILRKRERLVEDAKDILMSIALAEAKRKQAIEEENYIDIVMGFFNPTMSEVRRATRIAEAQKEIDDNKKKLETLKTDLKISFIDEAELKKEKADKEKSEREKEYTEYLSDLEKFKNEIQKINEEAHKENKEKEIETAKDRADAVDLIEKQLEDARKLREKDRDKANEERKNKEIEREKFIAAKKIELAKMAISAISSLTSTLFANALLAAKGNAKKEYDIKKRQFNFEKASSATEFAVNNIVAISKNYSKGGLIVGSALNAIQIGIAAVGLAAILAKKFPPFEGGGADTSLPSPGGGGGGGIVPNIQSPAAQQQLTTTQTQTNKEGDFIGFGGGQRQQPLRAYIVETEVTSMQKNISNIEERAKF